METPFNSRFKTDIHLAVDRGKVNTVPIHTEEEDSWPWSWDPKGTFLQNRSIKGIFKQTFQVVWLREFGNHGPPSLQNWCLVILERKGVDSG
jgi:hypothetical protein